MEISHVLETNSRLTDSTSDGVRRFKVAFLGGAYESAVGRVHRTALEMDQHFELVAGCFSRNKEANKLSAIWYGIDPDRTYNTLVELLLAETCNIDAIVILSPQDQHAQHILACLDAEVPVICEKALVATVDEAVSIQKKLSSNNGFLVVISNYTGYPILRELKHMIEQNVFGSIQQLHMEMPQEGFSRLDADGAPVIPQEWRLRDGPIPTISLDLGVHLHMMARFLTGERPNEVIAVSDSNGNFKQVTDNVSCLIKYSNNLNCNVWYSKTALGYRNGLKLRVFGEKGSAEWVQENPEYLQMADDSGGRFIIDRASKGIKIANQSRYTRFKAGHPAGFIEAFANYYYDIANALECYLTGNCCFKHEYIFSIDESLEGLRMLNAIAKSSIRKCWETVA
ncbi:Gfo/Idh/MocA family oxidoreductase [Acidithiobacillus sp. RW2]|uniref:Gfo/Idh/MocA family oxidoreductase n=1 Tax=Acidithiobacillus sulfurivorans TaxID=1958756 RepID=A0ABS6A0Q8_9PROT|nr:Gfo/Idh/MocA family oxidoreductase [Acidithiobacillus sulfurivorans]